MDVTAVGAATELLLRWRDFIVGYVRRNYLCGPQGYLRGAVVSSAPGSAKKIEECIQRMVELVTDPMA